MHYYKFNIGDYHKSTAHLTLLEDVIYRRLIDLAYDSEKPLPLDLKKLCRLIRTHDNPSETQAILEEFFSETHGGWVHRRIQKDLGVYSRKADAARANGKKGGRPKITQSVNLANPEETETKANQEPLTTNHKPVIKPLSDKPDQSDELFDYWSFAMEKNASTKFTPKRKKMVKARLKDGYTPDQIKRAIDNCRADPWSMGQNDRQTPFNDLELICRSGEKLESFIDKTAPVPVVQPLTVVSTGRTRDRTLQDDLEDTSWAN